MLPPEKTIQKHTGDGMSFLASEVLSGKDTPFSRSAMQEVSQITRKLLDIPYGRGSQAQRLDLYLPEQGDGPFPLIVYFHGGGFAVGDKRDGHLSWMLPAVERGYALASVNYRLSGEATFPAAVCDAREAVRFLTANAPAYFVDSGRIGAIGTSSGGYLAAMLAMNILNGSFGGECAPNLKSYACTVKAAADLFGPIDFAAMDMDALQCGGHVFHNEEFSEESCFMGRALPEVSPEILEKSNPIHYISHRMCPLLIAHGSADKVVPYRQSERLYDAIVSQVGGRNARLITRQGMEIGYEMLGNGDTLEEIWNFFAENL